MARLNINVDDELYKELKKWCIENDTNITELITGFIKDIVKMEEK